MRTLLLIFLTGCSYVHYQRGDVSVVGIELGTDKALAGFSYQTESAKVSLDSMDSNQTDSLEAIAEGITKGAIKGAK